MHEDFPHTLLTSHSTYNALSQRQARVSSLTSPSPSMVNASFVSSATVSLSSASSTSHGRAWRAAASTTSRLHWRRRTSTSRALSTETAETTEMDSNDIPTITSLWLSSDIQSTTSTDFLTITTTTPPVAPRLTTRTRRTSTTASTTMTMDTTPDVVAIVVGALPTSTSVTAAGPSAPIQTSPALSSTIAHSPVMLKPEAIAGITVAAIGLIALLAALIIVLARCRRPEPPSWAEALGLGPRKSYDPLQDSHPAFRNAVSPPIVALQTSPAGRMASSEMAPSGTKLPAEDYALAYCAELPDSNSQVIIPKFPAPPWQTPPQKPLPPVPRPPAPLLAPVSRYARGQQRIPYLPPRGERTRMPRIAEETQQPPRWRQHPPRAPADSISWFHFDSEESNGNNDYVMRDHV